MEKECEKLYLDVIFLSKNMVERKLLKGAFRYLKSRTPTGLPFDIGIEPLTF